MALEDCSFDNEVCSCELSNANNIQLKCDKSNSNKTDFPSLREFLNYGSTFNRINLQNKEYSRLFNFSFNGLRIRHFNLESNGIEIIDYNAFYEALLFDLSLKSNRIKKFNINLTSLKYLSVLDLSFNYLESIENNTFKGLGQLDELNLIISDSKN